MDGEAHIWWSQSWWRHQMETFSALLALCAGNTPVPGEFPAQRPVTQSFDVFFDLRPNKRLSKQSWGWWFERLSRPLWRHRNNSTSMPISRIISPVAALSWIGSCRLSSALTLLHWENHAIVAVLEAQPWIIWTHNELQGTARLCAYFMTFKHISKMHHHRVKKPSLKLQFVHWRYCAISYHTGMEWIKVELADMLWSGGNAFQNTVFYPTVKGSTIYCKSINQLHENGQHSSLTHCGLATP